MSSFYKKEYCRNCRTIRVHAFLDMGNKYVVECLSCHLSTPERRFTRETGRINKKFKRFVDNYLTNNKNESI